jgi:hypothetical protein
MESIEQPPPVGDEIRDPLRRLEERLERATEAAERMISDMGRPPSSGWQSLKEEPSGRRPLPELETLVAALAPLRELIPPDAADRLLAALKEILLAVRALIDYYLERLDRRPPEPPEVQDIPLQ